MGAGVGAGPEAGAGGGEAQKAAKSRLIHTYK